MQCQIQQALLCPRIYPVPGAQSAPDFRAAEINGINLGAGIARTHGQRAKRKKNEEDKFERRQEATKSRSRDRKKSSKHK